MRILMTGASGFVGSYLSSFLRGRGHVVIPILRAQRMEKELFVGVDAMIHLAGEPLSIARWTKAKKEKILKSRTQGTKALCEVLAALKAPPKVFVSASAVGIYGDRGDEILSENSSSGSGFLSSVCREWEAASSLLEKQGIRTVQTRFGVVLGKGGGIVAKMEPLYRCGLGACLGKGLQWISWIALDDLARAMEFVLRTDIRGPVNFVSPNAARQGEFSHLLARLLHRPHFLKIPAFVLRCILGESAQEMLLSSTHAIPEKLKAFGFEFKNPVLEEVLKISL